MPVPHSGDYESATIHRKAHKAIFEVAVLDPAGGVLFTIDPNKGGSLTRDRSRNVRASVEFTCAGNLRRIAPSSFDPRILRPYGTEVRVTRGFEYADGSEEHLARATFRLTTVRTTTSLEGTSTRFVGQDRAERLDRQLIAPFDARAGEPYDDVIVRLLEQAWRGANPDADPPPFHVDAAIDPATQESFQTPVLHFEAKSNGFTEAAKLAEACGRQLYLDYDGAIALVPLPDRFGAPVWTFTDGQDDTKVEVGQEWASENQKNWWQVNGTGTGAGSGAEAIVGVAFVEDASTGIDITGAFGTNPDFSDSNLATSVGMCEAEAASKKTKALMGTDTVEITTLPIGFLLEGDVIGVNCAREDLADEQYVVTSITEPLGTEGTMSVIAGRG
jgi:hypothetical protein